MDLIARLRDRAVSVYIQVEMKDNPKLLKLPKPACPDIGYVSHDTSGQYLGRTLKMSRFLLNEICMVTHLTDNCGKDNLKKFFLDDGRNKVFSNRYAWMRKKKRLEESRISALCGRN